MDRNDTPAPPPTRITPGRFGEQLAHASALLERLQREGLLSHNVQRHNAMLIAWNTRFPWDAMTAAAHVARAGASVLRSAVHQREDFDAAAVADEAVALLDAARILADVASRTLATWRAPRGAE